ncbi:MAG TPA: hypothetical protein VJ910_11815, partial [Desulfuromonadales bacterium]|nr:hypothetical protein [Desulfuromonadales bacterium]
MPKTSDNLLQACQTLFGTETPPQKDFLARLQADRAKSAYRSQIKEHHPDRYEKAPVHIRRRQTDRFRDIHQAYRVIEEFIAKRQRFTSQLTDISEQEPKHPGAAQPRRRKNKDTRPADENQASRIPNIPLEFG